MSCMDIEAIRCEFPVTNTWIYMNHAAVAPISKRVQKMMHQQLRDVLSNGIVHSDRWETTCARTRRAAAKLLGARASEIAFVKNTTEGILIVANGLRWRHGQNVVIADREFPANVYPWLNLKSQGVETRFAPEVDGRIPIEGIFECVDDQTRVISVSSVEFASGFRHDLNALGAFCKERDIFFFVDAIQSLGALRLNVIELGIDFLSADAHKWLLGPEGAGIFYCSKQAMRHLHVSNLGWAANASDYLTYDPTPRADAQRFESGTLNTVGIYGLKACFELIEEIGIDVIEARILMLTDQLASGLKEKGYDVVSSRKSNEKSGIVAFRHRNYDSIFLFERLKAHQIVGAVRGDCCRLSPHVYNTETEIDLVLEVLPE